MYTLDYDMCVYCVLSLLISRGLIPPFQAKRGLRQGDSMSLYLSILAMVYLGRESSMLGHNGDFKFQPDAGNWVVFIYALLMIF